MCLSEFILNENLSENEWTWEDLNWSGSNSNTDEMEITWEHQSINKAWVNLHKDQGIWENLDVIWVSEHAKPCEPKWDSMNLTESKPDWVNLHNIIILRFDLSVSDTEAGEIRWVQTRLGDSDSERERSSSSEDAPSTQNTPSVTRSYDIDNVNDKVYY